MSNTLADNSNRFKIIALMLLGLTALLVLALTLVPETPEQPADTQVTQQPKPAKETTEIGNSVNGDDDDTDINDRSGTLKVTFRLRGDLPATTPRRIDNVVIPDESLVVDEQNKGIANVFLYVYTGRGSGTKLELVPPRRATLDLTCENQRFEPHAMFLRVGDTLRLVNKDKVGHNINFGFFANENRNLVIAPGQKPEIALLHPEPVLTKTTCNIHPWMSANLLVLEHPYAGISDHNGVVTIEGLPTGRKITFRAAHERGTFNKEIYVNGKQDQWKSNKFEVEIHQGLNDMGIIEIPATQFD